MKLPQNFTLEIVDDHYTRYPWQEFAGHGVITCARRDKHPHEVILHKEGGDVWLYDYRASMQKARAEGWGCPTGTPKERADTLAAALRDDMAYATSYLRGTLYFVGLILTYTPTGETESLWGVEHAVFLPDTQHADYVQSLLDELRPRVLANAYARAIR